ncbi:MAG: sigma-70 family RNA polymerase sigma factor [Planctomycetes bacterium]|nr:sigma-70 family RNA polymerase sigma factor [Planctomycetota bacterium]
MRGNDTSMGGAGRGFPSTVWSEILEAADAAGARYRELMDGLIRRYWKPVYAYVRIAWRRGNEDAKDVTQAFFARLLEGGSVLRLRPEKGTFRSYLRASLKNFLIDFERAEFSRRKIAGALSLDADPEWLERLGPAAATETPEAAYDREWVRCLVSESVEALRAELEREGKGEWYRVFARYCLDGGAPPTYRELAAELGLTETDVRHRLERCRERLRAVLRARILDTAASPEDADRELAEVLGW